MNYYIFFIIVITLNAFCQENNIDNLDDINVEKDLKQRVEFLTEAIKKKDRQYKDVLRKLKEQERKIQNYEQYVEGLKKEIESIRERMDEMEEDDQYQELHDEMEDLLDERVEALVDQKIKDYISLFQMNNQQGFLEPTVLVILANSKNPIKNITLQGLKKIYSGKLLYWKNNKPVICMNFAESTVERKLFTHIVLPDQPLFAITYYKESEDVNQKLQKTVVDESIQMLELIDAEVGSIGYIKLTEYIKLTKTKKYRVKAISVDDILPPTKNVSLSNYPFIFSDYE